MPAATPPMLHALALQSRALRAAPRLATSLARPPHEAHGRAASPVPISPIEDPADTQLFEHPTDPGVRYWLPCYRLRQTQGRYHIASALDDDGSWAVRFGLEQVPPPELLEAARLAQPLGHQREFVVRYAAAQSGIERQHLASEVSEDAAGIALTLRLTLEERDGLLRAFRSDAANARIVVTRRVEVAVPVKASAARPVWPLLSCSDATPPVPTAIARPSCARTGARKHRTGVPTMRACSSSRRADVVEDRHVPLRMQPPGPGRADPAELRVCVERAAAMNGSYPRHLH